MRRNMAGLIAIEQRSCLLLERNKPVRHDGPHTERRNHQEEERQRGVQKLRARRSRKHAADYTLPFCEPPLRKFCSKECSLTAAPPLRRGWVLSCAWVVAGFR